MEQGVTHLTMLFSTQRIFVFILSFIFLLGCDSNNSGFSADSDEPSYAILSVEESLVTGVYQIHGRDSYVNALESVTEARYVMTNLDTGETVNTVSKPDHLHAFLQPFPKGNYSVEMELVTENIQSHSGSSTALNTTQSLASARDDASISSSTDLTGGSIASDDDSGAGCDVYCGLYKYDPDKYICFLSFSTYCNNTNSINLSDLEGYVNAAITDPDITYDEDTRNNAYVDEDSELLIRAIGAAGRDGSNHQFTIIGIPARSDGGDKGNAGIAQLHTSRSQLGLGDNDPLYFMLGYLGASSIVSRADLNTADELTDAQTKSILAISGGGGGGGNASSSFGGNNGGDGALVTSRQNYCIFAKGEDGNEETDANQYKGHGGGSDNPIDNSDGDCADILVTDTSSYMPGGSGHEDSEDGQSGAGGLGGYSDDDAVSAWENVLAATVYNAFGTSGEGGSGNADTNDGGAGGGGAGGGGAGHHRGGGGGGGSFVTSTTSDSTWGEDDGYYETNYRDSQYGTVYFIYQPDIADTEEVVATSSD
ncbi:hypothetical protein [uncultured Shewanella sp.]|uniref:hypothetical protein n=1 Tax=uncultured Shewanella sp. TaxID=173975 RepID=UPI0026283729|nr:hypothetical protein [uncultured Shewanella sp.]